MTFVDLLRSARASRVAVLHEFWTQYDGSPNRLHLFFEGHDDGVFFRHFANGYLKAGTRVYTYRCDGKGRVFEAFSQIVERVPGIKSALFFVDKDVDDILGVAWPTDPRVFVTDVYSIENYLTTRIVVQRFFKDAVKMNGVQFDDETIFDHFEAQRKRFNRLMMPLMGWVITLRRANERPNLNNINLGEVFTFNSDCHVHACVGKRMNHLTKAGGVSKRAFRHVVPVARDLARMPPDRIVRGKYSAWFVVEFWKRLTAQLEELAKEANGKVSIKPTLEKATLVSTLTAYTDIPRSLQLFLEAHLAPPPTRSVPHRAGTMNPVHRAWEMLVRLVGLR